MIDALGWIAAGLTVATFSCTQPVALRLFALTANAAFIAYGASAGLWPVLALHSALLPINLMRLMQALPHSIEKNQLPGILARAGSAAPPLATTKE